MTLISICKAVASPSVCPSRSPSPKSCIQEKIGFQFIVRNKIIVLKIKLMAQEKFDCFKVTHVCKVSKGI